MVKNVFKEVFIMLLLCAAIVLILAVVFYDYNPINKVVPSPISYKMPSDLSSIKEEIESTIKPEEDQIIQSYEITEAEMKLYKKTNYDPGKANPFLADSTNNNTITNSVGNTTTNKGNTTNTGSTGSFFEDGSKK